MSDTSSLAENSSGELSDNYDEEYAVEVEDFDPQNTVAAEAIPLDQRGIVVPYADEPIADPAWVAGYMQRREAERKRLEEFQKRLVGTTELAIWYVQITTFGHPLHRGIFQCSNIIGPKCYL